MMNAAVVSTSMACIDASGVLALAQRLGQPAPPIAVQGLDAAAETLVHRSHFLG
jgi:hypothetical protein